MRRALALALALSAVNLSAMADETSSVRLRPFIGGGFTWGGDTMLPVKLIPEGTSTEYEEDISAGAGLDLRVGLSLQFANSPLILQASLIHHNDETHGITGRARFKRTMAEIVALWQTSEKVRLGIGARRSITARFSESGFTCTIGGIEATCPSFNDPMKSSVGLVLEAEYMLTPDWGLKARYVREGFRFKEDPEYRRYSGDHIGFVSNYYFN